MGLSASKPSPRPAVPEDKIRLCVSGFGLSPHTGRARKIAEMIVSTYPDKYETWFYFDSFGHYDFLAKVKAELSEEQQQKFASHTSSPFCWLEMPDGSKNAIGGRDRLVDWANENFKDQEKDAPFLDLCKQDPPFHLSETLYPRQSKTPATAKTE
mmetsp:Transcript_56/g.70  ORF Transcript_56/g.70 Transcript_56/m.70 type:complete len:155 (+) Transcript_56:18-482(+)|eukprot:CAMPEP_0195301500 /NCGR_PEP_ID=MMETSP0707-20130614/29394_1 /TAXON_ID=33640 /ORGANISM="Asterionellopsis glacialis, Strain CCMP134" /LENGTH=154 /DNA_ID=CAMNT_0040364459 /DNA_START=53 /DNA_END=517 /DNA_ORIENTATION=-